MSTITFETDGLNQNELDKLKDLIDTLIKQKVFLLRNSSAEIFIDDEGILQEIRFNRKKRRRADEDFRIFKTYSGNAVASFDDDGVLQQVIYQTTWKRKLSKL